MQCFSVSRSVPVMSFPLLRRHAVGGVALRRGGNLHVRLSTLGEPSLCRLWAVQFRSPSLDYDAEAVYSSPRYWLVADLQGQAFCGSEQLRTITTRYREPIQEKVL